MISNTKQKSAADCKSVKTGSIPVPASFGFNGLAMSLLSALPSGNGAGKILVPFPFRSSGQNRRRQTKKPRIAPRLWRGSTGNLAGYACCHHTKDPATASTGRADVLGCSKGE